MPPPRLLVTGSSGFLGRHVLDRLKERYRIVGIARRSQLRSRAPVHPNIEWHQVDIAEVETLRRVFDGIAATGGVDEVLHLAAHYDFTGVRHPEYHRTNVVGLRAVLEECRRIRPRRFVFSSSLAACRLPPPGAALDESSAPDGEHVYAETKGIGERMLAEYRDAFPSVIVRFAALFSDWCEYPPLFMFLRTWLSEAWNRRILGGRGQSAIPYLHVRDAAALVDRVLGRPEPFAPGEVLIASPADIVSHLELFEAATSFRNGRAERPILMPRPLCGPGMRLQLVAGRVLGRLPFERPWMARYIDLRMAVDPRRTWARLGWEPRKRLALLRRLPFLLDHMRMDPVEWSLRNRMAMKEVQLRPNLRIHLLLERHEAEIHDRFGRLLVGPDARDRFPSYQRIGPDEHLFNHRLVLHQLMNAIRTRERSIFLAYCRDLAEHRFDQGFGVDEVSAALSELNRVCVEVVSADPDSRDVREHLYDDLTMTMRFGIDQVQDTFDQLSTDRARV